MIVKKELIVLAAVLLPLFLNACSIEVRPDPFEERAARAREIEAGVMQRLEAYYLDFSALDWEAYRSHFWPGATIATAWQPPGEERVSAQVQTVDEFVAVAGEGPGSREIFEEWIVSSELKVAGNLAHAWVRYGARFGDPGDVQEWEGIDSFSFLNVDGEWKIASLVFAAGE